jgi:hypothetical protein
VATPLECNGNVNLEATHRHSGLALALGGGGGLLQQQLVRCTQGQSTHTRHRISAAKKDLKCEKMKDTVVMEETRQRTVSNDSSFRWDQSMTTAARGTGTPQFRNNARRGPHAKQPRRAHCARSIKGGRTDKAGARSDQHAHSAPLCGAPRRSSTAPRAAWCPCATRRTRLQIAQKPSTLGQAR